MHEYWRDVRRLWWSEFKRRFEAWQLYAALLAAFAVVVLGPNVYGQFEGYQKRWWMVLLPIAWSAASALKDALELNHDLLEREYVNLGDSRAELERALRGRDEDIASLSKTIQSVSDAKQEGDARHQEDIQRLYRELEEARREMVQRDQPHHEELESLRAEHEGRANRHLQTLSEHLIQGQKIHSRIRKASGPPDPGEYMMTKPWSQGVEDYLNEHLREHLATYRMPDSAPRAVIDGMNSQRAWFLNSFGAQLDNLQKIIRDVRG